MGNRKQLVYLHTTFWAVLGQVMVAALSTDIQCALVHLYMNGEDVDKSGCR